MQARRRYFGTDGIRGRVGTAPITPDFVLKLGWAVGRVLAGHDKVLIGKDTRISGYMFESALEAGLSAAGVDSCLLGPVPTPAVAYLIGKLDAAAGIMISASHNGFADNGIKLFNRDGMKLSDETEAEIEAYLQQPMQCVSAGELGRATRFEQAVDEYGAFCRAAVDADLNLSGLHIAVDCAHGADYRVAPEVLRTLGVHVTTVGVEPDGLNINRECGSTHLQALAAAVIAQRADLGIAFDGDGDRVLMIDHRGNTVNGDQILFVIADHFHRRRPVRGVAGTAMSNLGLESALRERDIAFVRTGIGDRHVLSQLLSHGWFLGGEPSGHVINLHFNTTGDGLLAALHVLEAMRARQKTLSELAAQVRLLPQKTFNVPVAATVGEPMDVAEIRQAVCAGKCSLAGRGRVLIRRSGTEPLIRIMVEGEDAALVDELGGGLAQTVRECCAR